MRENFPDLDAAGIAEVWSELERLKQEDPLTALQDGIFDRGKEGGQMRLMQMGPNFEIAMYLAQATRASIVYRQRIPLARDCTRGTAQVESASGSLQAACRKSRRRRVPVS